MAIQYPLQIDTLLTVPKVTDLVSPIQAKDHNVLVDVALAVEAELGINPSGSFGTVKDRLDALESGSFTTINDAFEGAVLTVTAGGELEWVAFDAFVSTTHPLVLAGHTISIPKADASTDGYLSKEDWATFNAALGGGLTESQHHALDDLVHNLAENFFEQYSYSGTQVTGSIVWETSGMLKKIRETQFSYSGSKVVQEVNIQYNSLGVESQRQTLTYSYSGTKLTSITAVET